MFITLWMAFALMFALIGIGVFWWKKNENLSTKEIFKNYLWKIVSYIFFIGAIYGYMNYIPFNKNHGVEFNNEREKLGIPKIGENWKNKKHQSDQFTTYWYNVASKNGHIEKFIEYDILDITTETDYYKNANREETLAWCTYNFRNNTFEYFIKKLNHKTITTTEPEKQKTEKSVVIQKIDKSEFDIYIAH